MKIYAPFTPEQVTALNRWQATDRVHPFTCPRGNPDGTHVTLVATTMGWRCTDVSCDYRQDWAHDFMAEEIPDFFPPRSLI